MTIEQAVAFESVFTDELVIIDVEQNTPAWEQARSQIVTASEMKAILAKSRSKSDPDSKTRLKYMRTLASEIITGQPVETYQNAHMLRGHLIEDHGRELYGFLRDCEPQRAGFWQRGRVGASPDSRVGDRGLLELKSKSPWIMLEILKAGTVPEEHLPQLQAQLWVGRGEVDWVDCCCFWPGLKPAIFRIEPDYTYWRELEDGVGQFLRELDEMVSWYRSI